MFVKISSGCEKSTTRISNKYAIFENKRRERYSINYNDYTFMPTESFADFQCFLLSEVFSMFEVIPDKTLG